MYVCTVHVAWVQGMCVRTGVHVRVQPPSSRAHGTCAQVGGRDVLLFAVYVQEYDGDCPPPNTNRTYISYVDSVPFLDSAPANARTPVYHAVLGGYLEHAAACGFEYCHLWVAPPEGSTEYAFRARARRPSPTAFPPTAFPGLL